MTERQRRTVRVENHTVYPTREVQKLVRRALREAGVNDRYGEASHTILVRVRHHTGSHAYQGRWYHGVPDVAADVPYGVRYLMLVRLAKPGRVKFPYVHERRLRGGPPPIIVNDWRESLVAVTAHEGHHAVEEAQRVERRLNGRVRHSEVDSEWMEFRALERFKEEQADA